MVVIARGSKGDFEFEKVTIDNWIEGEIVDVQERVNEHKRYLDKKSNIWKEKTVPECRFVFQLDGYEYKHYSRWMTLSTNENSHLYDKYLRGILGEKAIPDATYDLSLLTGIKVKTMWDEIKTKEGGTFQFVDKIKALGEVPDIEVAEEEIPEDGAPPEEPPIVEEEPEDEKPF